MKFGIGVFHENLLRNSRFG